MLTCSSSQFRSFDKSVCFLFAIYPRIAGTYVCAHVYIKTSNVVLTPRPTFYSNAFTLLKLAASLLNLNFRLVMFYFNFSYPLRFRYLFYTLFGQKDRIRIVQFSRQSERKWLWNWWNTEEKKNMIKMKCTKRKSFETKKSINEEVMQTIHSREAQPNWIHNSRSDYS